MGLTRLDIPHVAYKRSLSTNLTNVVKAKYGFKNGNFGTPGRSKNKYNNVRNIESNDPIETSKEFMIDLVTGFKFREAIKDTHTNEIKGHKFIMKDGAIVVWRLHSTSDGSPAVDINVEGVKKGCLINMQKIHFIKEKKK